MSAFCALFQRNGEPVSIDDINAMVEHMGHLRPDRVGRYADGPMGLGHLMLFNTPESIIENLPFVDKGSGCVITADARIDNRDELIHQLNLNREENRNYPDSLLILEAYLKWGEDCPCYLIGDFSFAIWDSRKRIAFCVRDHMGCKPFFYYIAADRFACATEMKGFLSLNGIKRQLNEKWIADALSNVYDSKDDTPWKYVYRLEPAHILIVSENNIQKKQYWSMDPHKEIRFQKDTDYVEAFQESLHEAVRCRTRSAYPIGSELSGGIDSSTVTAIGADHAKRINAEFWSFSHILSDDSRAKIFPYRDERDQADLVRKFCGLKYNCYLSSEETNMLDILKRDLWLQDGPVRQHFHNGAFFLYKAAQSHGVRTLLSGFGGDELVSSQAGGFLNDLSRKKDWITLWKELREQKTNTSLWLRMATYMCREYIPVAADVYRWIKPVLPGQQDRNILKYQSVAIDHDFAERWKIKERFLEKGRNQPGELKIIQQQRIMHPHVPQRMEYCAIAAASRRVEYRYPLLDIRLMERYLAFPSSIKYGRGFGRLLIRKSIEGLLPREIQWRDDKFGSTIPMMHKRILYESGSIKSMLYNRGYRIGENYLDLDNMISWHDRINNKGVENHRLPPSQGIFLTALMLLMMDRNNYPELF